MAATPKSSQEITAFGKRFVKQIWSANSSNRWALPSQRTVHSGVYEKNVEEDVRASNVPDEFVKTETDKYWGPDPKTGVFGPATGASGGTGIVSVRGGNGEKSVLEETAWLRHSNIEDQDKSQCS